MIENLKDPLLVIGSLNAKQEDRSMRREDIRSVQLFYQGEARTLKYFNEFGELGVSSMDWTEEAPQTIYFTEGQRLFRLDLVKGACAELTIPRLLDVHEITCIDGELWLSNTGYDEVVSYKLDDGQVSRIQLQRFKEHSDPTLNKMMEEESDAEVETVDRFHCNQIFKGHDGHRYCLVHHVSGMQLVKKFAQKIIKTQGNGGVINLDTGQTHALNLKAPHTVRKVNGDYWIFSSGHAITRIYDKDWNLKRDFDNKGWARGGSLSSDGNTYFAGVSAPRKRYLNFLKANAQIPNMVEAFDVTSCRRLGEIALDGIEQVNNVYTLSKEQAEGLLSLPATAPVA